MRHPWIVDQFLTISATASQVWVNRRGVEKGGRGTLKTAAVVLRFDSVASNLVWAALPIEEGEDSYLGDIGRDRRGKLAKLYGRARNVVVPPIRHS
jgi:hypothetical protein